MYLPDKTLLTVAATIALQLPALQPQRAFQGVVFWVLHPRRHELYRYRTFERRIWLEDPKTLCTNGV